MGGLQRFCDDRLNACTACLFGRRCSAKEQKILFSVHSLLELIVRMHEIFFRDSEYLWINFASE